MNEQQRFERELASSDAPVRAVVEFLPRIGLLARQRAATGFVDRAKYKDHGDLEILSVYGRKYGEVKGRTIDFTDCASFPYPTILLDRVNKTTPLADYYFTVNKALSHVAIVITADTRQAWQKKTVRDSTKPGYGPVELYECPKKLAVFARL